MKFSTREDIEAPVDAVYRAVTDFEGFEQLMLRRGIEVRRANGSPLDEPGACWKADFTWRGRRQELDAELVAIEANEGYAIESKTGGVTCMGVVDLVPLSKSRTRLLVSLDLHPSTLSARLFIQSLRLAKGSLTRKFKARVAEFARRIER